jgi:hypothetical protein
MKQLKRLYHRQVLSKENWNEVIDILSGLEKVEMNLSEQGISFEAGSSLEGTEVLFNKDINGFIHQIIITSKETSYDAPFTSNDGGLTFTNPLITDCDSTSSYTVLNKSDGTTLPSSYYSLGEDGVVRFATPYTEMEILVTNLDYQITKVIYSKQDPLTNQFIKFSETPIEPYEVQEEFRLIPLLLSNEDEGFLVTSTSTDTRSFEVFRQENDYDGAEGWKVGSMLPSKLQIYHEEKLILKRYGFKPGAEFPTSWILQGSLNGGAWVNIHEVNGWDGSVDTGGYKEWEVPNPMGYTYHRIKVKSTNGQNAELGEIQFYGVKLNGTRPNNENVLGRFFQSGETDNGTVKITSTPLAVGEAGTVWNGVGGIQFTSSTNQSITFEYLLDKVYVDRVKITPHTPFDSNPAGVIVEGSMNGSNWEVITSTDLSSHLVWREFTTMTFPFTYPRYYKFFKVTFNKPIAGNTLKIGQVGLFGYRG